MRKIDGGEYYEASVKVSVGKQFLGWLFSMNGKVEAVDPKIREMMLSNIEELRNTYKWIGEAKKFAEVGEFFFIVVRSCMKFWKSLFILLEDDRKMLNVVEKL